MCWFNAVAQTALGVASTISGQYAAEQQAYAQGQAMKQQADNAIKSMNYGFQNYEVERQDAFDQAVSEITKTRMNALGLNASVDAAINEDYAGGGRTADLLKRSVRGDEARAVASTKENYERKSNEIDLNKETALLNTKMTLAGLKPPKMPSRTGMYIGIGSTILGGYTSAQNAKTDALKNNLKFDFWKGAY